MLNSFYYPLVGYLFSKDPPALNRDYAGLRSIIHLRNHLRESYPATLEHISPKGVEESGAIQFEIKAAVLLEEGQFLRAGYSANAEVVLDKRKGVLTLSEMLVQYDGSNPFVEVEVAENTYERRDIELGLSDGLSVEVISGITAEDAIKVWNKPSYEKVRKGGRRGKKH